LDEEFLRVARLDHHHLDEGRAGVLLAVEALGLDDQVLVAGHEGRETSAPPVDRDRPFQDDVRQKPRPGLRSARSG